MTTPTALLGPDDGWSLAPVADWLFGEGRCVNDPVKLLDGLAQQLDRAGTRVDRMAIMSRTLHPQFVGWSVFWTRPKGAWRMALEHAASTGDAYLGIGPEHVPADWLETAVVHLAPVANEVDPAS